jgi:hypothetical protein
MSSMTGCDVVIALKTQIHRHREVIVSLCNGTFRARVCVSSCFACASGRVFIGAFLFYQIPRHLLDPSTTTSTPHSMLSHFSCQSNFGTSLSIRDLSRCTGRTTRLGGVVSTPPAHLTAYGTYASQREAIPCLSKLRHAVVVVVVKVRAVSSRAQKVVTS